jgi:hypothetical protein
MTPSDKKCCVIRPFVRGSWIKKSLYCFGTTPKLLKGDTEPPALSSENADAFVSGEDA